MAHAVRVPVSAIVTSCNEASLLPRALAGITFCDEIIVVEVGSGVQETSVVADRFGARFVEHAPAPIVEAVRFDVIPEARNDLILLIDPDEEVPAALAAEVVELIGRLGDDVAVVEAPIQYYFAGKPLRGTVWGGRKWRRLLVRRAAVTLAPTIYGGMRLKDGYRFVSMPYRDETAIAHRWASGWRDLTEKHRRYLVQETADRANAGEITGWREIARTPSRSFLESFFRKRGYLDGLNGFALSIFWAGFRTAAECRLLKHLRSAEA
jgi:hypothetical protein